MSRLSRTISTAGFGLALLLAACAAEASPFASATAPEPTATPEASATASAERSDDPTSEESPSTSGGDQGGPFSVLPNAEADALFLDRNSCQNVDDGYQLQFPSEWNTNAEIGAGAAPPCSWFSPTEYEVDDPNEVPEEVAITIERLEGDSGSFEEVVRRESVIVGETQEAVRVEYEDRYLYQVQLGPTPEEGPNLLIQTTSEMGGDFELNMAILDRMMTTMELIGTIE